MSSARGVSEPASPMVLGCGEGASGSCPALWGCISSCIVSLGRYNPVSFTWHLWQVATEHVYHIHHQLLQWTTSWMDQRMRMLLLQQK